MTDKKFDILMLLQILFAIFVVLISIYSLLTENFNLHSLMFILLSAMFFILGLREYKRTQSLLLGIFYLCISLFALFVAVNGIMKN